MPRFEEQTFLDSLGRLQKHPKNYRRLSNAALYLIKSNIFLSPFKSLSCQDSGAHPAGMLYQISYTLFRV